jgi:hypothetical protein
MMILELIPALVSKQGILALIVVPQLMEISVIFLDIPVAIKLPSVTQREASFNLDKPLFTNLDVSKLIGIKVYYCSVKLYEKHINESQNE